MHCLTRATGGDLIAALRAQTLPDSNRFIWFGGESAQAAAARAFLKSEHTLLRNETSVSGYWTHP
ncbi:SIP domain-containing protein [Cypionkella sp.]|uniref:SIP domain-containing protein n=1 Tax=Cypionkella sp. TaxID=2811411 RepID=UPI0026169C83|nr:SIP domain-containing protein [Cypionkella sp.]